MASAPIRADCYKRATRRDLAPVKGAATWSRLMFSDKARSPKELADAAVAKAVAGDAKTLG